MTAANTRCMLKNRVDWRRTRRRDFSSRGQWSFIRTRAAALEPLHQSPCMYKPANLQACEPPCLPLPGFLPRTDPPCRLPPLVQHAPPQPSDPDDWRLGLGGNPEVSPELLFGCFSDYRVTRDGGGLEQFHSNPPPVDPIHSTSRRTMHARAWVADGCPLIVCLTVSLHGQHGHHQPAHHPPAHHYGTTRNNCHR